MTIQDPTILDALRAKGCLASDGTVDRGAVVNLLATELEANHVAHTIDDVADVAVTPGALAVGIFGVSDPELSKYVASLLSPGLAGKVQTALADSTVLCATRSKVAVELPGGDQKWVTVATRFLTDDPDTIAEYLLDPVARRTVGTAKRAARLGEVVKDRQPEMAVRVDEWTGQLQIIFQTALTAGSGS
jgi:hypothetical protein